LKFYVPVFLGSVSNSNLFMWSTDIFTKSGHTIDKPLVTSHSGPVNEVNPKEDANISG
jgi:hypothetical protein